jgi:inhibitor of cysteine peptidase
MRKLALLTVLLLLVAACGQSETGATSSEPTTTDGPGTTSSTTLDAPGGEKAQAFVDSVELLLLESYPVQVKAIVRGSLPTPCHTLAWNLGEPGPDASIVLEVYSTFDSAQVCAQVLQPFEQSISIGAFTIGNYVLVVNGVDYRFSI